jgi:hypothetical protein
MKIYLLEQSLNQNWDTYDSIVVIAESEDKARLINPYDDNWAHGEHCRGWVSKSDTDKIKVTELGVANKDEKPRVVLASFNAG